MTIPEFVQSIPYNGLSHLIVNGYEYEWTGISWKYIGLYYC